MFYLFSCCRDSGDWLQCLPNDNATKSVQMLPDQLINSCSKVPDDLGSIQQVGDQRSTSARMYVQADVIRGGCVNQKIESANPPQLS
jgi:hypothetical protein